MNNSNQSDKGLKCPKCKLTLKKTPMKDFYCPNCGYTIDPEKEKQNKEEKYSSFGQTLLRDICFPGASIFPFNSLRSELKKSDQQNQYTSRSIQNIKKWENPETNLETKPKTDSLRLEEDIIQTKESKKCLKCGFRLTPKEIRENKSICAGCSRIDVVK